MHSFRGQIAAVLPFLLLAGCEDWDLPGSSDRFHEDFHYSYSLTPGGTLSVDNSNGSIEITGWDKDTVDIEGAKFASYEERMKAIQIDISHNSSAIAIRTLIPRDWHGNAGARYIIHVPRRVELQNIASSNGHIRVDNIEGRVRLRSSNGSLDVTDVTGDTTAHTSNGSIRADVKKGIFDASTSNGSITARLIEPDSAPVRLESSNGRIDLTISAPREVHADTSNSSITVHLPASAGANVRAHTSNSSISSDFDVSVRGGMLSKHRLEGTIGSGGPTLDLGTSNGPIRITRM